MNEKEAKAAGKALGEALAEPMARLAAGSLFATAMDPDKAAAKRAILSALKKGDPNKRQLQRLMDACDVLKDAVLEQSQQ